MRDRAHHSPRIKPKALRSAAGILIQRHYLGEVESSSRNDVLEANVQARFVAARKEASDSRPGQGWARRLKAVVDSGFLAAENGNWSVRLTARN